MLITTRWLREIVDKLEKVWSTTSKPIKMFQEPTEFPEPKKNFRISICTTCMNRLEDLKQTLPKNIEDNLGYNNVEFVLLDYNSKDGLEEWVKEQKLVESGLVFFRTDEPKFYTMAHSRNVAYKAASGDIVTNVDADNFTGPGFADRVNRIANQLSGNNVFLKSYRSTHGRVGFWKEEFIKLLGGYDETFVGYGHDDRDLIFRAMELGFSIARFGGEGSSRLSSKANRVANYDASGIDTNWRFTEQLNKLISYSNLMVGNLVANMGKEWGKAKLIKNFTEEVIL